MHKNTDTHTLSLTSAYQDLLMASEVLELFHWHGDDFDLDLYEQLMDLDDEVREKCNIDLEYDRHVTPSCWKNSECSSRQVCDYKGECSDVTLKVHNNMKYYGIEFGLTARGATPHGGVNRVAGASPFQRVSGLMDFLGYCSHHSTVTYERTLQMLKPKRNISAQSTI